MFRLALHWQILIGMVLGVLIGIGLRAIGTRQSSLPQESLPPGVAQVEFQDSPDEVTIVVTTESGDVSTYVVGGAIPDAGAENTPAVFLPTLKKLSGDAPEIAQAFHLHGRSWGRWLADGSNRLGKLFLRMLHMVAVPLIVTSLITGVMGVGHASRLGKMFGRTIGYYLLTSLLAICTGLLMVNVFQPGLKANAQPAGSEAPVVSGNLGETLFEQLETLVPKNPIAAMADGKFLSIISFSLLFAIFAVIMGGRNAEIVRDLFTALFNVMMRITMAIIKLAPLGVMLLMIGVVATQGISVFQSLAWYMLTVVCALVFHACVVLPLILKFVAKRSPVEFAKAMSPALLTAFSSASSNGTLPVTLTSVENRAGVSNRVSSFVLPLGATINMDGTALYEAVAVLFIAQLHHGENLPIDQQIVVALTALLASVGAAGIPHAGLVMMLIILNAVGLPVEMQGIIIAVDRVLDMCRTSVNVWSDSCGCAVVERLQTGETN
ncbi:MAG: dicarboxylate/amino acid:cation symporter [Blastopirellula sp.]|nr:dicarboxylate/amino acid:cation symporter [Blastopirellula sp.]